MERFGFLDVEVDVAARQVWRGSAVVTLQRKPFDLLVYLVEHRDRVVTADELLDRIWADEHVGPSSVSVCLSKIRRAVGDDKGKPRVIQTVHGCGYRFIAPLENAAGTARRRSVDGIAGVGVPVRVEQFAAEGPSIVGRSAELDTLLAAWRRALAGGAPTVFVAGPAGIGKTTVVRAFLRQAVRPGTDLWVLEGACVEQSAAAEPLMPFVDAFVRLCQGPDRDEALRILRAGAPGWLLQLEGLLPSVLPEAARADLPAPPFSNPARALVTAVGELARTRPTIVVLDDLHWSDPTTVDVLHRLTHEPGVGRLMLLGTYRPVDAAQRQPLVIGLHDQLKVRRRCETLDLEPLATTELPAFIRAHAAAIRPTPALCEQLFLCTRGHPLFMTSVLGHLERGGAIGELPDDLGRMIEHELDELSQEVRRALEIGSLIGSEFSAGKVAETAEVALETLEDWLVPMARRRHVIEVAEAAERDEDASTRFRFVHPVYPEVLRLRANPGRCRVWHRRIAEQLLVRAETGAAHLVPLAARHLALAGRPAEALHQFERAVEQAKREIAHHRVASAAAAALPLLAELEPSPENARRELILRIAIGETGNMLPGFGMRDHVESMERALSLARSLDDRRAQHASLMSLSLLEQMRGNAERARVLAEEMVGLIGHGLPSWVGSGANARLGEALLWCGDLAGARAAFARSRQAATVERPDYDYLRWAWMDGHCVRQIHLACELTLDARHSRAQAAIAGAVDRARQIGHAYALSVALSWAAGIHFFVRDRHSAAAAAEEAARLSERHGFNAALNPILVFASACAVLREPTSQHAEELVAHVVDVEGQGVAMGAPLLRLIAAEAFGVAGAPERGLEVIDKALAATAVGGERLVEAELYRLRGDLLSALPTAARRTDAIDAAFASAARVASAQSATLFEIRAALSRARWLSRVDRRREAAQALKLAVSKCGPDCDAIELREIAELLQTPAPRSRSVRKRRST